jgi:hypothetical protein
LHLIAAIGLRRIRPSLADERTSCVVKSALLWHIQVTHMAVLTL